MAKLLTDAELQEIRDEWVNDDWGQRLLDHIEAQEEARNECEAKIETLTKERDGWQKLAWHGTDDHADALQRAVDASEEAAEARDKAQTEAAIKTIALRQCLASMEAWGHGADGIPDDPASNAWNTYHAGQLALVGTAGQALLDELVRLRVDAVATEMALTRIHRALADKVVVHVCQWCDYTDAANPPELWREHLLACPGHPMRQLEEENTRLRGEAERLSQLCGKATLDGRWLG